MLRSVPTVLVLICLCCPGLALGQGLFPSSLPGLAASSEIKPGSWVRYTMLVRKSGAVIRVRLAALDKEGDSQWFELSMTDSVRGTMTFKALIKGGLASPKGVEKVLVQPHGQRPLLLPTAMAKNPFPAFISGPPKKAKLISSGKVKVAGGTFKAKRYRTTKDGKDREIWLTKEVPGWPLIKVDSPEVLMELADHGTKATSAIKGKPLKLDTKLAKQLGISIP